MNEISKLNKNAVNTSGVRSDLSYNNRMDQMRYFEALQYCKDKVVLDIACGVGWGTYLLASAGSKFVYGVDISESAIADAKKFHSRFNNEYFVGDVELIPIGNETVDIIICLETIEHVNNPQQFFSELNRVIKREGILVLSSPNSLLYKNGNKPYNPYHFDEYTRDEVCVFANKSGFELKDYFGQYMVKNQKEVDFYLRFIRNYWFIRRIQMTFGTIGKLISTILMKCFKNYFNLNDPALEGNCSPRKVEDGYEPAHHYFIFKKCL